MAGPDGDVRGAVELLERQSMTHQVLRALRAAIVEGRIAQGAQLRETQLAAALGTGRSVVREAMRQLVQEGLARHEVHRGIFVCEITPEDFVDVYRAREAVEIAAVELILKASAPDLTRVHAALDEMAAAAEAGRPWQEVAEIDMSLHEAIVEAAESPRLVRMFASLAAESRMVVHWSLAAESRVADAENPYPTARQNVLDHRAIVDALAARDSGVLELLRVHLVPSADWLALMRRAGEAAA